MAAYHPDLELMAGDDRRVPGQLLDVDGSPLDLSAVTLAWVLLDSDANPVAMQADVSISAPATAGQILISVSKSVTASLNPGRYFDCLRLRTPFGSTVAWERWILVSANYF